LAYQRGSEQRSRKGLDRTGEERLAGLGRTWQGSLMGLDGEAW
jgi:hypothetical protein